MEKLDRWLVGMSILVVLAYAWLTAWSLEPRFQPPANVSSGVAWLEDGRLYSSTEIAKRDLDLVMRVQDELRATDTALSLIGKYRIPPSVVIHLHGGARYVVDGERVDLSDQIAKAPGQLTKAMLKAWWYQRPASAWASSSFLRFEVITDVLTALARNEAAMGNPETGEAQPFPELSSWLDFASSYDSSRDHSWSTLELRGLKGRAPSMNPLAFRPLLAAMLWDVFAQASPLKRLPLARSWVNGLLENRMKLENELAPPESLTDWRDWLRREFQSIAGPELSGERELQQTGLLPGASLIVASKVFVPDVVWEMSKSKQLTDAASETWALKDGENEFWLLTRGKAWLKISASDWKSLRAARFMWAGCKSPSVEEVLSSSDSAEKLIFASVCDPGTLAPAVLAFAHGGLQELASLRPEIDFMQMRHSALELALRQKRLRPGSRLEEFMNLNHQAATLFGLDKALWNPEMNAYRVIGAIEAVEWVGGKQFAGYRAQFTETRSRLLNN